MQWIKSCSIVALLLMACLQQSIGQEYPDSANSVLLEAIGYYDNDWIHFRPDSQINPLDLFTTYKAFFGLGENDVMELVTVEESDTDLDRYIFQQKYQNTTIMGADYLVHVQNERVVRMNGKIAGGLDMSVTPAVSEDAALISALEAIGADEYAWEDFELEHGLIPGDALQRDSIICIAVIPDTLLIDDDSLLAVGYFTDGIDTIFIEADSTVPYLDSVKYLVRGAPYPTGELIIALKSLDSEFAVDNLALTYHFQIIAREPARAYDVYVDAQTGEVLIQAGMERSSTGDCNPTLYNGNQDLTTKWTGWQPWKRFVTWDDGRKFRTIRFKRQYLPFYGPLAYVTKEHREFNNHYGSSIKDHERIGASAHWAIQKAWDYFSYTHSRNGHTGNGSGSIVVYLRDRSVPQCNAQYLGRFRNYQDEIRINYDEAESSCNIFPSLDIMAHEFTHAVIDYSVPGGFRYAGESGALEESFSDIFATMVEFNVEGAGADWKIGEDLNMGNDNLRTLNNPNVSGGAGATLGQPNCYQQSNYWYFGTLQDKYVHINSGVQNYWFYLLAEGGSNNGITVNGIGKNKAAAIAYRNLTRYMQQLSNYADAKSGSIYAAIDLYGECSNEVIQTINAWNAVCVRVSGGVLQNRSVNCSEQSLEHAKGRLYGAFAINTLDADCAISNNTKTIYTAGEKVLLKPGFLSGTGNSHYFRASISDCLSAVQKAGVSYNDNHPELPELDDPFDGTDNNLKTIVFPNPSSSQIKVLVVQPDKDVTYTVSIMDIVGRQLRVAANVSRESVEFDVSDLPAGVYFVNVRAGESMARTKFVKH